MAYALHAGLRIMQSFAAAFARNEISDTSDKCNILGCHASVCTQLQIADRCALCACACAHIHAHDVPDGVDVVTVICAGRKTAGHFTRGCLRS